MVDLILPLHFAIVCLLLKGTRILGNDKWIFQNFDSFSVVTVSKTGCTSTLLLFTSGPKMFDPNILLNPFKEMKSWPLTHIDFHNILPPYRKIGLSREHHNHLSYGNSILFNAFRSRSPLVVISAILWRRRDIFSPSSLLAKIAPLRRLASDNHHWINITHFHTCCAKL